MPAPWTTAPQQQGYRGGHPFEFRSAHLYILYSVQYCTPWTVQLISSRDILEVIRSHSGQQQKKDTDRSKGKGRCFCMGGRIFQFLAAPAILSQDDFGEKDDFIIFFKSSQCNSYFSSNRPVQNRQRSKELNKFCPPNRRNDFILLLRGQLS